MTKVAATEFARNFGRYREAAQHEAVAVVTHNRITGYFVSARDYDEYQRLKAGAATALAVEENDRPSRLMAERCRGLLSEAPADWQGVFGLKIK